MQIPSDPSANNVTNDPNISPAPKPKSPNVTSSPTRVAVPERSVSSANTVANSVASEPSEPNVLFRRDANGQIYYVLTDPQSGKELREVPPEEVRKVGEGIADYLKQEQEKQTQHVQVKA